MAIAVRSVGTGVKSTSGSYVVGTPAGVQSSDLLIAVHIGDTFGTDAALTATGWTQVGATYSGTGSARGKIWQNTGATAAYTFGNDDTSTCTVLAITGADTVTPINITATWSQGASAQTNHIAPSITTTAAGCLLICGFASTFNSTAPTYTPPAGMTEQSDLSGNFAYSEVATLVLGAAGVSGTKTAVSSLSTVNEYTTVSLAIAPAAAASGLAPEPTMVMQAVTRAAYR